MAVALACQTPPRHIDVSLVKDPGQAKHAHPDETGQRTDLSQTSLRIMQGQTSAEIKDGARIEIARQAFSFVFPLRHYGKDEHNRHSARIAGSGSNLFLELRDGTKIDETNHALVLFAPGTGMASDENGKYSVFFLEENHAHHYVVYSPDDKNAQRASMVQRLGPQESLVRFDINQIRYDSETFQMTALPLKELYFVIFLDKNLNRVIDKGEAYRFTLVLRQ